MGSVIELSLQIALAIALPLIIIRRDINRLPPERLSRAWNDASLLSAVVTFGPLSLIVHFARTRRSLRGFLLGIIWAALGIGVSILLGAAFG